MKSGPYARDITHPTRRFSVHQTVRILFNFRLTGYFFWWLPESGFQTGRLMAQVPHVFLVPESMNRTNQESHKHCETANALQKSPIGLRQVLLGTRLMLLQKLDPKVPLRA